jgi:hypothetical protein
MVGPELRALLIQLGQALKAMPPDQIEVADATAAAAEDLVKAATMDKPNKIRLRLLVEALIYTAKEAGAAAQAALSNAGECPECGGIKPPVVIAGPFWVLAQTDCRSRTQTRRCRPRTEPAAASRRHVVTIASVAPCSSVD